MKLDRSDKIFLAVGGFFFVVAFIASMIRQEKISRANIKIETEDHIYYSLKETIEIKPNLCISFIDALNETRLEHCGRYTVTYLK